ncbi:MAG: hypothetical protein LBV74_13925 [Tannerella sp.]|jgi:hypothetical protein|nr:hypothetical protein [Tannerella sp.]
MCEQKPYTNPLQIKPPALSRQMIEHTLQRGKFIDLIYQKIEREIPTTSISDIDVAHRIKTQKDISRAKKIISQYVVETLHGVFVLISPETRKPSYISDMVGGMIKFSADELKWDAGMIVSKSVKEAGDYLVSMAKLAETLNRLNPRYDKYYRNPLVIGQNKAAGAVLSKSGKGIHSIFKVLASKPFAIFEMLFFDPQSLNPNHTTEDDVKNAVVRELIILCKENKYPT